jgi:hypothetical protein
MVSVHSTCGEMRNTYTNKETWTKVVHNTEMKLEVTGYEGAEWIHLTQDSEHGNKPLGPIKRMRIP